MTNFISEDNIEKAILKILVDNLNYRHINCYTADPENLNDGSNRTNKKEVVLFDILKEKVKNINPELPEAMIDQAINQLTNKRYSMSSILANKEVYKLIRDGIPIEYQNKKNEKDKPWVKVIDFNNINKNDFLAVSQIWIRGEQYYRRPDIILYINGLPLVFIELKIPISN